MDRDSYVDAIATDAARIAAAARRGLGAKTPSCPGWDVAKVVLHTGLVHRNVCKVVVEGSQEPWNFSSTPRAPDGEARIAWFEEGAAALVEALGDTDPAVTVWNFVNGPGPAAFWHRRMAHETSIHRHDAESAHGEAVPVDAELASDGVDEMLTVLLGSEGAAPRLPEDGLGGTVHLHCTDVPGEWLVDLEGGKARVERVHAKGDVAVRGPASDLDLFVWNRARAGSLDIVGNAAVAERWSTVRF